jgi:hypothetical protein
LSCHGFDYLRPAEAGFALLRAHQGGSGMRSFRRRRIGASRYSFGRRFVRAYARVKRWMPPKISPLPNAAVASSIQWPKYGGSSTVKPVWRRPRPASWQPRNKKWRRRPRLRRLALRKILFQQSGPPPSLPSLRSLGPRIFENLTKAERASALSVSKAVASRARGLV